MNLLGKNKNMFKVLRNNLIYKTLNYYQNLYSVPSSKILRDISTRDSNRGRKILEEICFRSDITSLLFIDIGANQGQEIEEIIKLSAHFEFDFYILSFEPVPELFELISKKFARNIQNKTLEVNQLAIGKSNKKKLYLKDCSLNNNDGSSTYKSKSNVSKKYIEIKTKNLSQILSGLEIEKYSHVILKIDAEGSEYDILSDLVKNNYINIFSYILFEDHFRKMKSLTWQIKRLVVRKKLSEMRVAVDDW